MYRRRGRKISNREFVRWNKYNINYETQDFRAKRKELRFPK